MSCATTFNVNINIFILIVIYFIYLLSLYFPPRFCGLVRCQTYLGVNTFQPGLVSALEETRSMSLALYRPLIPLIHLYYYMYLDYIVLVLTLATFLYGVTSWCIIKKFRHFKNYVYLNLILTGVLSFIVIIIMDYPTKSLIFYNSATCIYMYLKAVYSHWLVVLCYICYVDIVKVFRVDIRRRYLKSNIFAWAVPVITVSSLILFSFYVIRYFEKYNVLLNNIAFNGSVMLPLVVNFLMYIKIQFSLCHCNANSTTNTGKWRRFYMATLIFVFSDIVTLYSFFLVVTIVPHMPLIVYIAMPLEHVQTLALNLFFVAVKSNRTVWREYYSNKIQQKEINI